MCRLLECGKCRSGSALRHLRTGLRNQWGIYMSTRHVRTGVQNDQYILDAYTDIQSTEATAHYLSLSSGRVNAVLKRHLKDCLQCGQPATIGKHYCAGCADQHFAMIRADRQDRIRLKLCLHCDNPVSHPSRTLCPIHQLVQRQKKDHTDERPHPAARSLDRQSHHMQPPAPALPRAYQGRIIDVGVGERTTVDQLSSQKQEGQCALTSLRLFFTSDWRIQPQSLLEDLVSAAGTLDLVLYGGDDVARFFHPGLEQNLFVKLAVHATQGLAGVVGNDCTPRDRAAYSAPGVRDIHRMPFAVGGWGFIGLEGAPDRSDEDRIGFILHAEHAIAGHLEQARRQLSVPDERLVIVSHAPPQGVLDTAIRFGVRSIGSSALAAFVERYQPALVLCGHVHNRGGKIARMGRTVVVNAANDDQDIKKVHACVIELIPNKIPTIEWMSVDEWAVFALPGVGEKTAARLHANGFFTPGAVFSATDAALLAAGFTSTWVRQFRLMQRATDAQCPLKFRTEPLDLPPYPIAYDVETGLENKEPWLIGVSDENGHVTHWTAPDENAKERRVMFENFLAYLQSRPGTLYSWSTSNYDRHSIRRGLARWAPDLVPEWERMTASECNLLLRLRRAIVMPMGMDWTLSCVARWANAPASADVSNMGLDGWAIGAAYERYLRSGTPMPIEAITAKNADDVRQVLHIRNQFLTDNAAIAHLNNVEA
jgi:RNase_H superfamily